MNHTHTNTPVLAKRVVAFVLAASMCANSIGQATAITYDSTTSTYFDSVDDYGLTGSSDSVGLQFGGTLGEFLRFNRLLDKFILTDDLDVQGTISGHALKVMGTAAISGALVLEGSATLSGGALRGFGLSTDCDNGTTSKLLWDATTGRFSCGTDQSGGSTGGGISQSDADLRYVNTHGDTMTGTLLLNRTMLEARGSGAFIAHDPSDVVLVVRGTGSQMGDLQQWKDSSDTLLVNVAADGNITAGNATFNGNVNITGSNISLGNDSTDNVSIAADVNTDINPEYNSMQGLGNSSYRWNGWFYDVDTSNNLNVGNNISTSNLSASSYTNLTYLNVSNSVNLANYANTGNGCSALETNGMGDLVCGTDDAGGGWGSDYFTVSNGSASETIDETNTLMFAAGDSNISVNVSATDTVTIGFTNAAGFITSESDPTYYSNPYGYINSSSDNIGYDTYFNITDGSTTELINTWDNVTFSDGLNMNVTVSATDTVTIGTADNVSFTNLNVSDGSTFGDNISDTMNISAGNWTFANETIFTMNGGPLRVRGVLSGVTLYATRSFSGAGLSDCDTGATSKLLWDATTGRFSCGTDQSGGSSGGTYYAGQGLSLNGSNSFSLNATVTGSKLHAVNRLSSSGTAIVHGNNAKLTIFNTVDELKPLVVAKSVSSQASMVWLNSSTGETETSDGLEVGNYHGAAFINNREAHGLNFGTQNVAHLNINDVGNVGVGVDSNLTGNASIDAKFEVVDDGPYVLKARSTTSTASVFLQTNDTGNTTTDGLQLYVDGATPNAHITQMEAANLIFGTSATEAMRIGAAGNIGISNSGNAPKAKLAVQGTISGTSLYAMKSFSGAGLSDCDNSTTSKLLWDATTGRFSCGTDQSGGSSSGGGGWSTDTDMVYLTTSTDSVGIGTTSPDYKLDVYGNTDTQLLKIGGDDAELLDQITIGPDEIRALRQGATANLSFNVPGGNVGIGISDPTANLHVYGSSPTTTVEDSAGNGATVQLKTTDRTWNLSNDASGNFQIYDASQAKTRFLVNSSGNVGVGDPTPHSTFTASGSFATRARIMTATGSINGHDNVIFASGSSMITVTLPSAVGIAGRQYTVKKTSSPTATDSRPVIVATTSSQTIDRVARWRLTIKNQEVTVVSDGSNWQVYNGTSSYGINGGYMAIGTTMNQWYGASADGTALTTAVFTTTATIRVLPFVANRVMTINGMAVSVQTTAASAEVRMALYNDNGRGYPDTLVVDAGTVATTTTGVRTICPSGCTTTGAGALPTTIQPGLYWIAINNNSIAHTLRGYAVANLNPQSGFPSNYTTARNLGWQVANAYGAFPTAFPTGATATTAAPLPAVTMRIQE